MTDQPESWAPLLSSIASLLKAVAWPATAVLFFIIYKSKIGSLIEVFTNKLSTATKLKAWQFELESKEQEVQEALDKTGEAASSEVQRPEIPEIQLQAAKDVNRILADGHISERRAIGVVQRQLNSLIAEYEQLRIEMRQGPARTRKMNEVAAKMRALSLASRPLLRSLVSGQSAGERLAAICILQVAPEYGYFPWLIERIKKEEQPFVFFQAAVAVLELVRAHMYSDKIKIKEAIEDARQHIASFKGGPPDQDTIDVLGKALSQLR